MGSIPKAPAGHFNILYFAAANSFTAKQHEALPAPLPLSKLFPLLEERYAGIKAKILDSCLVTVNLEYVDMPVSSAEAVAGDGDGDEKHSEGLVINEGDEVAIIPPVSSG